MADYKIAIKIAGQLESSFGAAISKAKSGLNGLNLIGSAGKALFKATTGSLALAGSAMAAFGGYAVKTGQEFESAMSSAAATAAASPEEYQKMSDAAREMGRATTKTAAESANALEYMALAGWDVDTSIKALPSVLRLSEASGMELARTSDLVTDSMSALGVSVDQLPGYLDVAARAQNKSNQTAEQLMEAYLAVGGTMNNLNVPIQESATVLGVLANRGIKGSEAGTALNAVMINLTTGAGKAGTMMKKLGVSAFDSEGKFKGVEATLQEVNSAMAGMTDEEKNAALAAIGGKQHVDALNAVLSGLNTTTADGRTEWKALSDELYNCQGALEEMAATKTDNLAGDLERMKSAMADLGIEIYQSGAGPLGDLVKFATDAFNELRQAYSEGGFNALAATLGKKLSELAQKIIEAAPQFIEAAASLVENILTGIENNVGAIGQGAGKIITTLGQAILRIAPKLLVVGAKLIVEIVRGIVNNFPALAQAAKEAVDYLWNAIKNAFTNAKDTLGDETAAPLEKFLALLPMIAAGFMGFAAIGGIAGKLKGFIGGLKGVGGAGRAASKGLGAAGSTMSSFAKNMLGVGASIALVAGGFWLLSDAAIRLANAGPAAQIAMAAMVGGVAALMVIAGQIGPKLQASATGFLAFGGAVLMAAGGMALMAVAAAQMAQAGDMAVGALAIMVGGLAGLMAIAGALGPQMTAGATGLLAFGGAMLMCGGAMLMIANAAAMIGSAGNTAMAGLAVMIGGIAALMAVAGALGPALTASVAGLLAFGAAMLMISGGMLMMANAAVMITEAGTGAGVAMAAMMAGVVAMGVACGALSPILLVGAAALAAFGGALMLVGGALMMIAAAAQMGVDALTSLVEILPEIAANAGQGSAGIMQLAGAITAFSASAALLAAGAGMAAIAVGALGVTLGIAGVSALPLAGAMAATEGGVNALAYAAPLAAEGMKLLQDAAKGMAGKLTGVVNDIVPLAAAMAPLAAAAMAAGGGMMMLMGGVMGTAAGLLMLSAGLTAATAALNIFKAAVTAFSAIATQFMTAANNLSSGFNQIVAAIAPAVGAFTGLAAPTASVLASLALLSGNLILLNAGFMGLAIAAKAAATAMTASAVSARMFVTAINQFKQAGTIATAALSKMTAAVKTGMTMAGAAAQQGMMMLLNAVRMVFMQLPPLAVSTMAQFVAAIAQGMTAARAAALAGANGIKSAIASVKLQSTGADMMRGLLEGINSMRSQIISTARSIANEAARVMRSALKVKSPSRVTMEIGKFTGEGLALGMEAERYKIGEAAQSMAAPIADLSPQPSLNLAQADLTPAYAAGGTVEITFSPNFTFNGPANEQNVKEAVSLSFREFENMMKEYERKNRRLSFN